MILTEQEIKRVIGADVLLTPQHIFARAIESAVLEKLKAQKPFGYYENGRLSITVDGGPDKWRERKAYRGAIYIHPLPPADVVRDAERLDWLMNSGRMVICDKEGCYTYTHTSGRYGPVAKTQREAIDAAMKEMK